MGSIDAYRLQCSGKWVMSLEVRGVGATDPALIVCIWVELASVGQGLAHRAHSKMIDWVAIVLPCVVWGDLAEVSLLSRAGSRRPQRDLRDLRSLLSRNSAA